MASITPSVLGAEMRHGLQISTSIDSTAASVGARFDYVLIPGASVFARAVAIKPWGSKTNYLADSGLELKW